MRVVTYVQRGYGVQSVAVHVPSWILERSQRNRSTASRASSNQHPRCDCFFLCSPNSWHMDMGKLYFIDIVAHLSFALRIPSWIPREL